jgi:integrase
MTPDGFTGYATSGCNPLFTTAGMNKQAALDHILKDATPTSSIMTGKTALRSSKVLSLRWSDVLWEEGQIRISKRWAKGEDGDTKTEASKGHVPMHPVLAEYLRDWHIITPHGRDTDFVFPSLRAFGKVPLSSSIFVNDHLRPAAISAGVAITKGQRFGTHNLRHSLSTCLVNQGKVAPKTVRGMLRHANVKTTLNLSMQDDRDEKQAAQGAYLSGVGLGSRLVQ